MPTVEEIIAARLAAGLSQKQAAELIGRKRLTWLRWEKGDTVDLVRWEKFLELTKKLRRRT